MLYGACQAPRQPRVSLTIAAMTTSPVSAPAPVSSPPAPAAVAAFLRGVERRAIGFAELQAGAPTPGDAAVAATVRRFHAEALGTAMSRRITTLPPARLRPLHDPPEAAPDPTAPPINPVVAPAPPARRQSPAVLWLLLALCIAAFAATCWSGSRGWVDRLARMQVG